MVFTKGGRAFRVLYQTNLRELTDRFQLRWIPSHNSAASCKLCKADAATHAACRCFRLNRRRSRVSLDTRSRLTRRTGWAARYNKTPPSAPNPVLRRAHHTLPSVATVVADAAKTVPTKAEASRRRRDTRRS